MYKLIINLSFTVAILFFTLPSIAQSPKKPNSSDILLAIKKLNVCGSVLYLAAHPDDENTNLITVLANEKLLNTTYLSLTRGDGGQNLIGTEQGDKLGVIRTQELLQARKIDGGQQLFTRARDFGFSKLPDETFSIWEKEKVLADVVLAVRYLQPDIIITRFSLEPGKTHGHHTASAMLGVEAFDIASDASKFPEQLSTVSPWQPFRIVWNSSKWFYNDDAKLMERKPIIMDCGNYNALLGKSYNEISAESRSMHKSQGFGSSGNRGSNTEYFEHLKGPKATNDIFEGIDFTWNRVPSGAAISPFIDQIISNYNPEKPSLSVAALLLLQTKIQQLPDSHWKEIKLLELKNIIKDCLGLYMEVSSSEPSVAPSELLKINVETINRSANKVLLQAFKILDWNKDSVINKTLEENINFSFSTLVKIPASMPNAQPYWLAAKGTKGMYDYESNQNLKPENSPYQAEIKTIINGQPMSFSVPIIFKKTDPVEGEIYKPLEIWNPIFVNLDQEVMMFTNSEAKNIKVILRAGKPNAKGVLKINTPVGWLSQPLEIPYLLGSKNEEKIFNFKIFPSKNAGQETISIQAIQEGIAYQQGYVPILHKHIPAQILLPTSNVKVVKLKMAKKGTNIAYIMGAGDEVPQCLRQVGYQVSILSDAQISTEDLKKYDALILGVRACNTIERMKFYLPKILQYAYEGGNVIVQYNTAGRLMVDSVAPYKIKLSADRVTVENASIRILKQSHPILNSPNKITDADFENWVQERGLYFPSQWGKEFEAILSCNDPNEPAKDGGLLVAKYGKGNYIYTGYSFFRELPAGVPGAYRLFANMIGLGK